MVKTKSALRQQIEDLLRKEEQERLEAGAAAGNKVSDHQPAEHRTPTGWAFGCTCGQSAGKRSARMSTRHVWFGAHVKKLGLPRFVHVGDGNYGEPVIMSGPAKGLTWRQARDRGIDINA